MGGQIYTLEQKKTNDFIFKFRCQTIETILYFCNKISTLAQMAELVDALVSNTNEETRAGSTPALGTKTF